MAVIAEKLRKIGGRFKKQEPKAQDLLVEFIHELEGITTSIEDVLGEMDTEYREQVLTKRSFFNKVSSILPSFAQNKTVKEQESKIKNLKTVRERLNNLTGSLTKVERAVTELPDPKDIGRTLAGLASPGEEITLNKVEDLEKKIENLEKSFVTSLDTINDQMGQVTKTLGTLSENMQEQGVKLERVETKIDKVDENVQKARDTLAGIAKKLGQNQTVIMLLLGAVIVGALLIILL